MIACLWEGCGGWIYDGFCVKCGRSLDLKHELQVQQESFKSHRDLQTSNRKSDRELRKKLRKEERDGREDLLLYGWSDDVWGDGKRYNSKGFVDY